MDELIDVMRGILSELQEINSKLDDIKGYGASSSLTDVCDKLDDLKGVGLYDSLADICNKFDSLEMTITSGNNY